MRVELAPEVFADTDDRTGPYSLADLHRVYDLLRCFAEERHEWVVADVAVVAAVRDFVSSHLPKLAGTYTALAEDAAVAVNAWTGTTQATTEPVTVSRANLADYSDDLCQRAVIVVENQESDGHFLETVAYVLNHERILTAFRNRWVEIGHGGGSDLMKAALAAGNRFRRVIRVVAVLDSDRLIPRQRTGSHDKARTLKELDIGVHVLVRREAENYVPDKVLAGVGKLAEASARLDRLKQLTPEQRGHYDMKHGFTKIHKSPDATRAHAELFPDLDHRTRSALHDGFGSDLLSRMHTCREALTEHDFAQLGPDVVAELRALLATIAGRI
ncbi:hypothetical protein O7626_39170 [Micromonospora sp. WMMD1102]|uniref:hypothetical protein n=1 Tax=Micromonospora sp. WMMD1102 TaxID=3016105 RepID=UPI002414FF85|nr:hypothetical protein [Micromonospora sp. WMMD1102]MDG4791838.1 hypothetical protein [Micromonospora sp. WMMD1102]